MLEAAGQAGLEGLYGKYGFISNSWGRWQTAIHLEVSRKIICDANNFAAMCFALRAKSQPIRPFLGDKVDHLNGLI